MSSWCGQELQERYEFRLQCECVNDKRGGNKSWLAGVNAEGALQWMTPGGLVARVEARLCRATEFRRCSDNVTNSEGLPELWSYVVSRCTNPITDPTTTSTSSQPCKWGSSRLHWWSCESSSRSLHERTHSLALHLASPPFPHLPPHPNPEVPAPAQLGLPAPCEGISYPNGDASAVSSVNGAVRGLSSSRPKSRLD